VFGWILNWAKHDDFDLAYAYFANLHKQMGAIDSLQ
jgi:hypothetical protein